ncbi:MAG TPA: EVE domain-containing protein [Trichormus sp.]|jgi:predicted RNA-binding protein with PUA-like domain
MAYWLFKTEPSCYSYEMLEHDKKTTWDGVTNALALKYLRQIRKGDQALIYHTGDVRAVVGIAEISSEPYVDPKLNDPKLVVVDLKPKRRLSTPVPLAEIKANKDFQDFILVKMGRLSIMPVTDHQWKLLIG